MKIGDKFKVSTRSLEELQGVRVNSYVTVTAVPAKSEDPFKLEREDGGDPLTVQREIFQKLDRLIPLKAGDRFRLPAGMDVPDFLRNRGVQAGSIIVICEDSHGSGLVEAATEQGMTFHILPEILSQCSRVGDKKNQRKKT